MTLNIKWQRLVSDGETCERCRMTESEVEEAVEVLSRALSPLGIDVELEKEELSQEEFSEDPISSNMVYVNGKPLEGWLDGGVGSSECCEVCGDEECRTVIIGAQEFEVVPSQLIIDAGMKAATGVSRDSRIRSGPSCC